MQPIRILVVALSLIQPGRCWADVITFEDLTIPAQGFENGRNLSGSFSSNGASFNNFYDNTFDYWAGWSYSNRTDTTTPGFLNQYSAIAGSGGLGSRNYGVGYQSIFDDIAPAIEFGEAVAVESIGITNTTWTYLSMRDGDAFAKKFGGNSGTDADFYRLTIEGFSGGSTVGGVDFYLGDFTFDDNTQDYLVDSWQTVDLSSLGLVDSLRFTLSSSDRGVFGINTPLYFAADNLVLSSVPEPVSISLLAGTGLVLFTVSRLRRRTRRA